MLCVTYPVNNVKKGYLMIIWLFLWKDLLLTLTLNLFSIIEGNNNLNVLLVLIFLYEGVAALPSLSSPNIWSKLSFWEIAAVVLGLTEISSETFPF